MKGVVGGNMNIVSVRTLGEYTILPHAIFQTTRENGLENAMAYFTTLSKKILREKFRTLVRHTLIRILVRELLFAGSETRGRGELAESDAGPDLPKRPERGVLLQWCHGLWW